MNLINLEGRKGLVLGIANQHSIAYGIARTAHAAGAEISVTYLNDKAKPHVAPLAQEMRSPLIMACDMQKPGQLEAVFEQIAKIWGKLDFVLHSIAYAPVKDLHGRVVDCSAQGFSTAMDISVHSFIRVAKMAEPLMKDGGCLLTLTYLGGDRVIKNYNLMGPVKAALQSVTQYLAAELGPRAIRVHAISPGPIKTRAASGIAEFDALLDDVAAHSPERHLVSVDDVGAVAAFLISDSAKSMTGNVIYVDAGYNIMGD